MLNLPIFIELDENLDAYHAKQKEYFARYNVACDGFLISAGSRLIYEKGYDLLLRAVSLLSKDVLAKVRVVIVGSGEEIDSLKKLVLVLNLQDNVTLEKWFEFEEFKGLIANSDIFSHPARFDAYGGTTLAMALGVPVVGTLGSGAAVDRIEHRVNGFLYAAEDINMLAEYILELYLDRKLKKRMGQSDRETAMSWHPRRGVDILLDNAI